MASDLNFEPDDKRVYTDPRYYGLQIVNNGGTTFQVFELNPKSRLYDEIDSFESMENESGTVSDEFAARIAQDYYNRLDEFGLSHGHAGIVAQDVPVKGNKLGVRNQDRDCTDIVNEPARDFADEQVMTPDDVLDMWEKAQAMQPGPEKEKLLAQARSMSQQLESLRKPEAEQVVERLLA